jgi:glycosyltransferase involved in cell wall biosynthesis
VTHGWDVNVIGINYHGDPHDYPYKIYPAIQPFEDARDGFGIQRLANLIPRLNPNVIVLLTDPWHLPQYEQAIPEGLPVVGWLAVDGKNQDGKQIRRLDHTVCWTQFAVDELTSSGYDGPTSIVPLGVDSGVFYPVGDKSNSRATVLGDAITLPDDAFVVGCVGRNQWPRKRLDLTIEYFAEWVHTAGMDNAYLYIHSAPTGERGYDIGRLFRYYEINGMGIHGQPAIGQGVGDELMRQVYDMMDVYVTTTQGEGWGLPTIEAMSCGVPCIVPDWSGLGDWTKNAAIKISCDSTAVSAPINGLAYTLGGIPNRAQFISALNDVYSDVGTHELYSRRGKELAGTLTWESTGQQFRHVLESVLGS